MSGTPRPRRQNANTRPADVLLTDKRPRRSSAQVILDHAALQAKREAVVQQRDEELRKIALLERQLNEKETQAAAYEARPPSASPSTTIPEQGSGSSSAPVGLSEASEMHLNDAIDPAIIAESAGSTLGVGTGQTGRLKRITREDLQTYREPEAVSASMGQPTSFAKENVAPTGGQKRKGEDKGPISNKKGRPGKPAGVTAAAKAKFSAPATRSPATTTTITNKDSPLATEPQGVYTKPAGGLELDADETINVERPVDKAPANKDAPGAKILQLSVVNVAAIPLVEEGQPAPVPAATSSIPTNGQFTMRHIEQILTPFTGLFMTSYIPKFIEAVGNGSTGPWQLYGFDFVGTMRIIAEQVWPGLHIDIVPRQPFFEVTKQKLSEYRNQVGNEALTVVGTYLQSSRFDNTEERAAYVEWAFHDQPDSEDISYPFRYEKVEECPVTGALKGYGAYQGTLIRRTLAYHVRRIGKPADQIRDHPCNALALATTAVERALKMWKTGSLRRPAPRTEEAKFSDRLWSRTASEYLTSIIDLSDVQWDLIMKKAEICARGLDDDSDAECDDHDDRDDAMPTTSGRGQMMDAALEEV